ncbi:PadR family transcriptional regulator [Wenjunlia vitaminophila]|uniref:PadR family transcriptional regulator n=1 Tax=Wenjunlia vitaminophila TaxID=76728 RepID=A0A0T6LZA1_WENVI|nr:helix-turn-helix transcriptional regulator [Wenjunlia vitaminophila]KRV51357.1 PadR family transcriptional regulator [Wenjunlia vitaminophila]
MPDLNPTAASLLGLLHAGEASGYELTETARRVFGGFWSLTRSQVYRELGSLAEQGLVVVGPTGARSRRPYRLTGAGRSAFVEWVAQPPGVEQMRYPLLLTLSFGRFLERETLLDHLAAHRVHHERRLAEHQYQDSVRGAELDPYQRATLAFGIRYEQAVLAWFDELPAILGTADQPGLPDVG